MKLTAIEEDSCSAPPPSPPPLTSKLIVEKYADEDRATPSSEEWRGAIFGKTIRCGYALLHVARFLASEDELECRENGDTKSTQKKATGFNETGPYEGDGSSSEAEEHCVVRVQFVGPVTSLRSHCRRYYKLGDLIAVKRGGWKTSALPPQQLESSLPLDSNLSVPGFQLTEKFYDPSPPFWTVDVRSVDDFEASLQVVALRYWGCKQYQQWQNLHLQLDPFGNKKSVVEEGPDSVLVADKPPLWFDQPLSSDSHRDEGGVPTSLARSGGGGGGGESHGSASVHSKRQQAEFLVHFFLHMAMHRLLIDDSAAEASDFPDPCDWAVVPPHMRYPELHRRAVAALNAGGRGVIDAAGGSGFVSMALGRNGVRSTVVDARPGVGKLPGRERKAWNRFLRKHQHLSESEPQDESLMLCQPVRFDALRAWFGPPHDGIDGRHRHPDLASSALPVCDDRHELLQNCSALLALHPDEATDAVVDAAISARIPFAVVPCCVFSRLFPARRTPSGDTVQTRPDLLAYLAAKHPSIRQTTLPFAGANTVLWSTF